jgi:chromosomal replication initiation ATPase DnaA
MTLIATSSRQISIARAERVIDEVAERHVLAVDEMTSRRKFRHLVDARSEAAYRLWSETELSLREIGELLGGLDHSSVNHLVHRQQLREVG